MVSHSSESGGGRSNVGLKILCKVGDGVGDADGGEAGPSATESMDNVNELTQSV